MSSWMHPFCFFEDVASLYENIFEEWTWFSDPGLTDLLDGRDDLNQLRAGNYTKVFTAALGAHDARCLYAWRKLNFAMQNKRTWID